MNEKSVTVSNGSDGPPIQTSKIAQDGLLRAANETYWMNISPLWSHVSRVFYMFFTDQSGGPDVIYVFYLVIYM